MLVFGVYMPPKSTVKEEKHHKAVKAILTWMHKVLCEAPRRTIPIACGDLNAQFGLEHMSGGHVQTTSNEWVGTASSVLENDTSKQIREWAEIHDLAIATTV